APGKVDALVLDHAGAVFEHGFVEEPVIWTLSEDRRAENPLQVSRAQHRAPPLTTCPECKAVRLEGRPCGVCGWRPQPRPEGVEIAEGELGEVDRKRKVRRRTYTEDDKLRFHRGLLWIARERNYKPGWVAHQYKTKFGHWPRVQSLDPMPPDDEVRS